MSLARASIAALGALLCACVEVGAAPGRLAAPDGAAGSGADVVGSQLDASGLAGDVPPGIDVLAGLDAMTAEDARVDAAEDAQVDAGPADAGPPPPPGSAGCRTGAGLAEGEHSFVLDGRARRYIVRLPRGYTRDRAWPWVLALHGNGGSAAYWDGTSGTRDIRGVLRDEAVLIVAEAIDGNWRDYAQPSSTWPARVEAELAYFEAIVTEVRQALCVREDGLFAMGFSGGGSFAGVLACRRTDVRAIAVGGSVIYFDRAACVGTTAAWITIGAQELTADRTAYRDYFRDRAGCGVTSTATTPSACEAFVGCGPATPVHYCQHAGGHEWPSFGSDAMWDFFRAQLD